MAETRKIDLHLHVVDLSPEQADRLQISLAKYANNIPGASLNRNEHEVRDGAYRQVKTGRVAGKPR